MDVDAMRPVINELIEKTRQGSLLWEAFAIDAGYRVRCRDLEFCLDNMEGGGLRLKLHVSDPRQMVPNTAITVDGRPHGTTPKLLATFHAHDFPLRSLYEVITDRIWETERPEREAWAFERAVAQMDETFRREGATEYITTRFFGKDDEAPE